MAMTPDLKKTVILSSEVAVGTRWTEELSVTVREQRDFEKPSRFRADELVAEIQWKSGEPRTATSVTLRPVNSIELRAFGVKCIELAGEMEIAQKEKRG